MHNEDILQGCPVEVQERIYKVFDEIVDKSVNEFIYITNTLEKPINSLVVHEYICKILDRVNIMVENAVSNQTQLDIIQHILSSTGYKAIMKGIQNKLDITYTVYKGVLSN